MLLIFNRSGNEFQVDFQYDSFTQGDLNTHIVDVIIEDESFSNYEYNGYLQFLREGETTPSPKLIMANKQINYNGVNYNGYTFNMASEWYTAISGVLKMTCEIKKYTNGQLGSNKAYGVVNIPVQQAVSNEPAVDTTITDEEYNSMVELINSKLNIADEKVKNIGTFETERLMCKAAYETYVTNREHKVYYGYIGEVQYLMLVHELGEVMLFGGTGGVIKLYRYYDDNFEGVNLDTPTLIDVLIKGDSVFKGNINASQCVMLVPYPTEFNQVASKEYCDNIRTFTKYSFNANGSGMSSTYSGQKYVGVYVGVQDTNDYTKYAWSKLAEGEYKMYIDDEDYVVFTENSLMVGSVDSEDYFVI